jgi:hypothetical protein
LALRVKMKNVKRANPQTSKYRAIPALYPTVAAPSAELVPLVEYDAASCQLGNCSVPNDNQKTANNPQTIIGKKLPMIHSKMVASKSRTGPVKKKIPLR